MQISNMYGGVVGMWHGCKIKNESIQKDKEELKTNNTNGWINRLTFLQ